MFLKPASDYKINDKIRVSYTDKSINKYMWNLEELGDLIRTKSLG